jgi:hypothetical protein
MECVLSMSGSGNKRALDDSIVALDRFECRLNRERGQKSKGHTVSQIVPGLNAELGSSADTGSILASRTA